ncbi:MAG: poly-gamma-glutamate hydrolase family protein [Thermodesulfobacteriota bacterium]
MTSPYKRFAELAQREIEGRDYQIDVRLRDERVLIMAPHGGKIEPTTSMIAEAIAGKNYSFYRFEGIKEEGNGILHIESHLFDEPRALEAVKKADVVVTVHGQLDHKEGFVMVGGLNVDLRSDIRRRLEAAGFHTRTPPEGLQGIDPENICNRGRLKGGVQLEVSRKERDLLKTDQERLERFAGAVRDAIQRFLRK